MAFVQRDSLLLALKAGCTAGVGLVAGSALYINVVEVPCALDYDAEHALQCWNSNFKRGKKFGPLTYSAAFLMAIGHYALTKGTEKADKKLLVALLLGELVFPYTLLFVQPTNNLLLDVEECKKQGSDYIVSNYHKWNKLHAVRSLICCSTFGYALYHLAAN
ncbi:uncharacterized protein [Clytia hemisphaerica]|uniref:Uncharacterized protein n=1 Tax=Clytia hemisphaerica TaxID=252671 RepID=A0A7M5XJH9_9CNID